MKMAKRLGALTTVSAFALSAGVAAVQAQDADDEDSDFFLEEVVVTAQKRAQGAQDVPISLQALGESFLDRTGAEDFNDIQLYTPGLEVDGQTQSKFEIRGVRTSDFGVGTEPAVGVFVDGVYVARSGAAITQFSDVERVEVLKGPQGTLFGRNAAAGAVSVITNKPNVDEIEGKVKFKYGKYNKRLIEGMLNLPLDDNIAFRANVIVNRRDGHITNEFDGSDIGNENNNTARFQIRYENDGFSANLAYDYDDTDQAGSPRRSVSDGQFRWAPNDNVVGDMDFYGLVIPELNAFAPFVGLPTFGLSGDTPIEDAFPIVEMVLGMPAGSVDVFHDPTSIDGADPFGRVENDTRDQERRKLHRLNMTLEKEWDWGTLTSITGWYTFKTNNVDEEDGGVGRDWHVWSDNIEDNSMFSQEIRLGGSNDDITWFVGASYFEEDLKQSTQLNSNAATIDTILYNLQVPQIVSFFSFEGAGGDLGTFLGSGGLAGGGALPQCINPALGGLSGVQRLHEIPLECLGLDLFFANGFGSVSLQDLAMGFAGSSFYDGVWTEEYFGNGKNKAWALYGDATWHATDKLNLTMGIRYTRDTKSWTWLNGNRTLSNESDLVATLPGLGDVNLAALSKAVLSGIYSIPIGVDGEGNIQCLNVCNSEGDLQWDLGLNEGAERTDKNSWKDFSPRFVVDYQATDDIMLFASWAQGYKAGGYNTLERGSLFDNEDVSSIEIGMKSEWFDRTLRFNVSGWQYDYKDIQEVRRVNTPGSALDQFQVRTSDQKGKGIDAEVKWAPSAEFQAFANLGWQKIRCVENCGTYEINGVDISADGDLINEPIWRFAVGADYIVDMNDNGSLLFHIDHTYKADGPDGAACLANGTCGLFSSMNSNQWQTQSVRNETGILIGWESADEIFRLGGRISNVFNNKNIDGAGGNTANLLGAFHQGAGTRGRSWFIQAEYKF